MPSVLYSMYNKPDIVVFDILIWTSSLKNDRLIHCMETVYPLCEFYNVLLDVILYYNNE